MNWTDFPLFRFQSSRCLRGRLMSLRNSPLAWKKRNGKKQTCRATIWKLTRGMIHSPQVRLRRGSSSKKEPRRSDSALIGAGLPMPSSGIPYFPRTTRPFIRRSNPAVTISSDIASYINETRGAPERARRYRKAAPPYKAGLLLFFKLFIVQNNC